MNTFLANLTLRLRLLWIFIFCLCALSMWVWFFFAHQGVFSADDGACEDCHPSCQSCSGHEKNQCTKCANGLPHTFALRPAAEVYLFIFLQVNWFLSLFCAAVNAFVVPLQGDFWPCSRHACQSVRRASLPVDWAECVRNALRAACSAWTLSCAAAAWTPAELSCSCRMESVFRSASGQQSILTLLFFSKRFFRKMP